MKLVRGISQLEQLRRPSVVSIGNFDGVHLGHQSVIETLLKHAKRLSLTTSVVTFDPLAKEFFNPDSVARLTSMEHRCDLLFKLGVEQILCLEFNQQFAAWSAERFIQEILLDGLAVKYLSVGDDFHFGAKRQGDFAMLQTAGEQHGFEVVANHTLTLDDKRISSGRIRDALKNNDFALAKSLLGRDYSIQGVVKLGQQLGRTLGYPTANVSLDECLLAVSGVYAVTAELANGDRVNGVANVGTRPTVNGTENRLEVHLFDFDKDIYGQTINVIFVEKIRDEVKFDSLDDLVKRIDLDAQQARQIFVK